MGEIPENFLIWGLFHFIITGDSLVQASQESCTLQPALGAFPHPPVSDVGVNVYFEGNYKGKLSFTLVDLFQKEDNMQCSYTDCI